MPPNSVGGSPLRDAPELGRQPIVPIKGIPRRAVA
jgi:hypothetical protein